MKAHAVAWVAIALAGAAGFIDAVSWLVLYQIYTAHMTGNTVSFAIELTQGHWVKAFHHGWPILPFIAGLLYGAATSAAARRRGFHSSFAVALITAVLLLVGFVAIGGRHISRGVLETESRWFYYALLSMPAAALGMQTVTVTRVNGLRVYTTFLTGSLSKFSESLSQFGFWFYDRTRGRFVQRLGRVLLISPRQKSLQHAALTAGLWISYFGGAVGGAWAQSRFALWSLLFPIGILSAAALIDLVWPVAAADDPYGTSG